MLNLATQDQETLVQPPSRSYPPPKLLQWGETTEEPTAEKNLIKNPKFESSYVSSYELAEYPEDAEKILQQSPVDGTQLYIPDGEVIIDPPSGKQNTIPNLDGLRQSGNEMFKLEPTWIRTDLCHFSSRLRLLKNKTSSGISHLYRDPNFQWVEREKVRWFIRGRRSVAGRNYR